jgi:hypothetical protein
MRPSTWALSLLTLAAVAAKVGATVAVIFVSGTALAEECPLSAPLVLKDTQDGFAGETGTVWTIAPDCNFTVAQQIGPKIGDPIRQGRLAADQQLRLKELLKRTEVAELPEKTGSGAQVNARRVTVSFGGKVSVLTLPPGGGDLNALRAAAGTGPAGRLLELAEAVENMTGSH